MPLFLLLIAGCFEVSWAFFAKQSCGFTKLTPTLLTFLFLALSTYFLGIAVKTLSLSTSYALWTAIGTIGTLLIGIFYFHEALSVGKIVSMVLIIIGIVGLEVCS